MKSTLEGMNPVDAYPGLYRYQARDRDIIVLKRSLNRGTVLVVGIGDGGGLVVGDVRNNFGSGVGWTYLGPHHRVVLQNEA